MTYILNVAFDMRCILRIKILKTFIWRLYIEREGDLHVHAFVTRSVIELRMQFLFFFKLNKISDKTNFKNDPPPLYTFCTRHIVYACR